MTTATGYIALTIIMIGILILIGNHAIKASVDDQKLRRMKLTQLISGLLIWHIYIYFIAWTGVLDNFELPPRFVFFLVGPAFYSPAFFFSGSGTKHGSR